MFNPFRHNRILDQAKLKAFADNKLNVTKMIISVFDRVENIVEKEEIACTSNFSFPHNVFNRFLSQTHQKVSLCGNGFTALALLLPAFSPFPTLFQKPCIPRVVKKYHLVVLEIWNIIQIFFSCFI